MHTFVFQAAVLLSFLLTFEVYAANPDNCVACHKEQVSSWQQSDHAKSMSVAISDTVLGDFKRREVKHYSQKATFYTDGDIYKVDLTEGSDTKSYTISYTFGHYPLQQYLTETDSGRLQVFPFAWDSRDQTQGGQRWYANYPSEDIQKTGRLHWLQPLQNWNGMCADCHSDGFKRNYDLEENSFDSNWDNINVGCQSCHGDMPSHSESKKPTTGLGWVLEDGQKVASWKGAPRDKQAMDVCFSCHSLRSPLTDGFNVDEKFLDQFSPSFLTPEMYHADGQIKEEVYVYGSFLQSKMYAAGVSCMDCHDAHTMEVKEQANALCLQCHSEESYQSEEHTFHALDSGGGQCVNCHMPETRFMGVDDRRDHSFKIPKPHLAKQFKLPNACISCHKGKDDDWALKYTEKWYGQTKAIGGSEQLYLRLQNNRALPIEKHLSLINDQRVSVIKRATAISMLPLSAEAIVDKDIAELVSSSEPLVRLAVARIGFLLSADDRSKSYLSLLTDEYKAVRVAAINELIGVGLETTEGFQQALDELLVANETSSWRGDASLNRSEVYAKQGRLQKSVEALQHAIAVDPYFDSSYVNLVDIYRQLGQVGKEVETYQAGLIANPTSSMLHYVKGLSLIRAGDKKSSVQAFSKAVEFDQTNPQFAFFYLLALDAIGNTHKALAELKRVIGRYPVDQRLGKLGLSLSNKIQSHADSVFYKAYLQGE